MDRIESLKRLILAEGLDNPETLRVLASVLERSGEGSSDRYRENDPLYVAGYLDGSKIPPNRHEEIDFLDIAWNPVAIGSDYEELTWTVRQKLLEIQPGWEFYHDAYTEQYRNPEDEDNPNERYTIVILEI